MNREEYNKKIVCPNSNKIFDNFLFKSGLIDEKLSDIDKAYERRRVYYTICVLFRLLIASLVLQLKDKTYVHFLIFIISFIAFINLGFYRKENSQWWSNYFQCIISFLLMILSLLILLKVKIPTLILPLLLYISVFGGVFQSLYKPSC